MYTLWIYRAARAKHLKEVEEEVNAQNDKAANGESTWTEKLYNFSDKTMEEFKRTHEGRFLQHLVKINVFIYIHFCNQA